LNLVKDNMVSAVILLLSFRWSSILIVKGIGTHLYFFIAEQQFYRMLPWK